MFIRKATIDDMQTILSIYQEARQFMAEIGNPDQWGSEHPREEILKEDISLGQLYVVIDDQKLCGVFALIEGEDPTYRYIEGAWHYDQDYATIHRIASRRRVHGILQSAITFALSKNSYIRIDTHEKNAPIHHLLQKYGFCRCGMIYLSNGSPRIAYDYLHKK